LANWSLGRAQDQEWSELVRCLGKVEDVALYATETRALVDTLSIGLPMLGEVQQRPDRSARTRAAGFELSGTSSTTP
jgi:hypothetical protein